MLELEDRPKAYEDVGRLCRLGLVIDELRNYDGRHEPAPAVEYVAEREQARVDYIAAETPKRDSKAAAQPSVGAPPLRQQAVPRVTPLYLDRRSISLLDPPKDQRRGRERRRKQFTVPFPDRRLTRSAYEQVFLKLVSGGRLRVGKDLYIPVGMKGWYHAIFRRESDGSEKLLTIDQLLRKMNDWTS